MKRIVSLRSAIGAAVVAALFPAAALAHTGVSEASGFLHGFDHPVSGLDHLLGMVLVGILACQLGRRSLWLVPLSFMVAMGLGGALGASGIAVPFVEVGIALSVVVFGAIVAFGIKAQIAMAMGIAGLFAIFHGHAHATEIPDNAGGLGYAAGLMLATALLHLVGIGLHFTVGKIPQSYGPLFMRSVGGIAAVAGLGILSGLL